MPVGWVRFGIVVDVLHRGDEIGAMDPIAAEGVGEDFLEPLGDIAFGAEDHCLHDVTPGI